MKQDARIAVLVPVYNAAPFLAETLASAIAQRAEGLRVDIFAIDDGSTDGSAEVLASFGSEVSWQRQDNAGVSVTRNRLLAATTAPALVFLDADDVLTEGTLARRFAIWRQGAGLVHSRWSAFPDSPEAAAMRCIEDPSELAEELPLAVFRGWWSPPGAYLVDRAAALDTGGFSESLPVIQDARFLLDLALNGVRFAAAGDLGLRYRVRPGQSLSRRNRLAFWRDCLVNAEQAAPLLRASSALPQRVEQALFDCFEMAARELAHDDVSWSRRALTGLGQGHRVRRSHWSRLATLLARVLPANRAFQIANRVAAWRRGKESTRGPNP